jgi:glutamine amidotransferase
MIAKADKIILPGVGAFDNGVTSIRRSGLLSALNEKVIGEKVPTLGICLGMQIMSKQSAEGKLPGLGWIDATTIKFKFNGKNKMLKIPHMGWNRVVIKREDEIFSDMYEKARFYFVHSYHVICENSVDVLATTYYGYKFTSAFIKDNIIGVQFHPEKSHKFGIKLFENFVGLS